MPLFKREPIYFEYNLFQILLGPVINLIVASDILTHSMVQSPSSEANWFAASQEIPRISRNPNVHYRTHKRPPPVSILGQPIPVCCSMFPLGTLPPEIRVGE